MTDWYSVVLIPPRVDVVVDVGSLTDDACAYLNLTQRVRGVLLWDVK